jgi:hypothetical protein
MKFEELDGLSLAELKIVADEVGVDYVGIKAKATLAQAIKDKATALGLAEVPDLPAGNEPMAEPTVQFKFIRDYPRVRCVIESRNPEDFDIPVGLNDYSALIKLGVEVSIPEPVYEMLKGLEDIRYGVDKETGMAKTEYIKRYIVSKV